MCIRDRLRLGDFDVLVGVNLLREGLDLPEVSLVAILDADKEGFLRNVRSLVQIVGRAARNVNGMVIMYADSVTVSMQKTIEETARRRKIQMDYNVMNNMTPTPLKKSLKVILESTKVADGDRNENIYTQKDEVSLASDPVLESMSKDQLERSIKNTRRQMEAAAKDLDFLDAARLRDELFELQKRLKDKK